MNATVSRGRGAEQVANDDEISLLQIASVVLRRRRLIIVSTLAGALLALLVALASPLEYTATFSFLPNGGQQRVLSRVAGVVQQFGLSTANAERSPEFYQALLRSREILTGVVRPGLEVVTATGLTTVDVVAHFEIKGETLAEQLALARELMATYITVVVGRETGVVTVSIRTDDPGLSAAIGRRLFNLILAFDLETRRSQAGAERSFSEERLRQLQVELSMAEGSLKEFLIVNRQFANSPQLAFEHDRLRRQVVMRQELVTAMAQAFEQARIDEVRNTPVITVIDQSEPPALPDPRGRLLKLLLGLTLGLTAGVAHAFIREFGERAKNEESEAYGEFQQVLTDTKRDPLGLRRASRPAPNLADSET